MTPYLFCQLAAFVVAHISRRRAHQTAGRILFHVFAHVDAYQGIGRTKHIFGQGFGQIRFANTRRPQEQEASDRLVGVAKSHPVPDDGSCQLINRLVLIDDMPQQFLLQIFQARAFLFGHSGYWNAAYQRNGFFHRVPVDAHIAYFHVLFPFCL